MRRRTRRRFDKFPEHPIKEDMILEDVREMEYMSKFRDWHVRTVFYFALLGMTDEQMAHAFDISMSTFSNWKIKHKTFYDALKQGKEQADAKVVYSLYQAAVGYEHESEQILTNRRKEFDPTTGKVIKEWTEALRVPITKRYPPSVKAAVKWLETRQPDQWTQRKEVAATLHVKHEVDFTEFSLEELKVLNKLGVGAPTNEEVPGSGHFKTTTDKELSQLEDEDTNK